VKVDFADAGSRQDSFFSGPVAQTTLGQGQYEWHSGGEMGDAEPNGPPSRSTVNGEADTLYELPKASITVLSGHVGAGG
jgi:hypothetical protein